MDLERNVDRGAGGVVRHDGERRDDVAWGA